MSLPTSPTWKIGQIVNPTGAQLWFSDGKHISALRGGRSRSSRLIIDNQGFIDISNYTASKGTSPSLPDFLDLNNQSVSYDGPLMIINLVLPGDGSFGVSFDHSLASTTGMIKPIPQVSREDILFLRQMIAEKYVPYPKVPDAPGKPTHVIKAIGKQLFPFSPYSFELAMSVYDWTTASFTRMVFTKIFAYTGHPPSPFPLDSASIAGMIWESSWGSFVASDPAYMNSFMMKPAYSLSSVQTQLDAVQPKLQHFSDVQNRVLAAGLACMPRTTLQHAPKLFSGRPDLSRLGIDRVAIEFLECPLNAGPPGVRLEMPFTQAIASFLSPGKVITTKAIWSFADSIDVAKHYNNGLIAILHPPDDNTCVWESVAYVTPLSDDPAKNEYTIGFGARFQVLSIHDGSIDDKPIKFINLKLLPTLDNLNSDSGVETVGVDNVIGVDSEEPTFDSADLDDIADYVPVVTDAAEVEANAYSNGEVHVDDVAGGDIDTGYFDGGDLDTGGATLGPRSALSRIPMRRVKYPHFNHYHTHLHGGRRCQCVEEVSKVEVKSSLGQTAWGGFKQLLPRFLTG